jgi:hypothetical protein
MASGHDCSLLHNVVIGQKCVLSEHQDDCHALLKLSFSLKKGKGRKFFSGRCH